MTTTIEFDRHMWRSFPAVPLYVGELVRAEGKGRIALKLNVRDLLKKPFCPIWDKNGDTNSVTSNWLRRDTLRTIIELICPISPPEAVSCLQNH
jgi:hypothetical protein